MEIIFGIILFIIAINVLPTIIGYVLGIALGSVQAIISNLDVIIPYIILYLPLKILQMTNWLQYTLQKPWRHFLKNPGETMFFMHEYYIDFVLCIILYVILTPLRAFNAFCYNMIVRNVFMLFDVIQEIFVPKLNKMRYYSNLDYLWRWIVYLPLRIIVFGGKFIISIIETLVFSCIEIVLPTLTLYHGTDDKASTSITKPNEWIVGNGAYAGYGIYFAQKKSTAQHYSRGTVIISRVTLGIIENLNLHPTICRNWVAKRGHSITQWAIDNSITTIEWWRTTGDYRWWEYCMVDHSDEYDQIWRIRPLYREDLYTEKYIRTWGGTSLWITPILKDFFKDF
jgi:hypothetical protein